MAELEKIIKVTQSQYDILASGGRVGSYVGLDDDYLYMVKSDYNYLPTNGGTITGELILEGETKFRENSTYNYGKGISFLYNHSSYTGVGFGINTNGYNNEIIYLGTDENTNHMYKPLLANADYALLYSESQEYLSNFTVATKELKIYDVDDTSNYIAFDTEVASISVKYGSNRYNINLPRASGTLATEAYVQAAIVAAINADY